LLISAFIFLPFYGYLLNNKILGGIMVKKMTAIIIGALSSIFITFFVNSATAEEVRSM